MILDLSTAAQLPPWLRTRINGTALRVASDFDTAVDQVSQALQGDPVWMFSSPASRNPRVCPLFYSCVCLALLQELLAEGRDLTEVRTDSAALAACLRPLLASRGIGVRLVQGGLVSRLKGVARRWARPRWNLARTLWQQCVARATRVSSRPLPENLILVDTFALQGHIDQDRYYGELHALLPPETRDATFFVPTPSGVAPHRAPGFYRRLRRSSRPFLLKEDFLSPRDIVSCWRKARAARHLALPSVSFQGLDVSPLFRAELGAERQFASTLTAWLNVAFAAGLARRGCRVARTICWFENQPLAKGWNHGFAQAFPQARRVGYLGFPPAPLCLNLFPTKGEQEAGVLPDLIAVLGEAEGRQLRQRSPAIPLAVAPAFRFVHIHQADGRPRPDATLLAALPQDLAAARELLQTLEQALNGDAGQVLVKPHPTVSHELVRSFLPRWPATFTMVGGDFRSSLDRCRVLVSVASSVCLEALCLGKPVVVMAGGSGLTLNPIPEDLAPAMWRLCSTPEDVRLALRHFLADNDTVSLQRKGRGIAQELFSPVTPEAVHRFMTL